MFVANVETCSVPTGIGGLGGNKGATVVCLTYKHTSIALVNCHLAAGVAHVKSRNRNATDVLSRASVGRRGVSLDVGCDYCFFFGDLNYRVDTLFETAAAAVEGKNWQLLWPYGLEPFPRLIFVTLWPGTVYRNADVLRCRSRHRNHSLQQLPPLIPSAAAAAPPRSALARRRAHQLQPGRQFLLRRLLQHVLPVRCCRCTCFSI